MKGRTIQLSYFKTKCSTNVQISFLINIHFNICTICLYTGITLAKKINKLGMRSSDTAQLFFEDVRVPAKNIIGDEGLGFMYQMMQFQEERLWAAAASKSGKIVYAYKCLLLQILVYSFDFTLTSEFVC